MIDYRKEGWDKFTFRASQTGKIMTDPKGKSNLEKYNDCVLSFEEKKEKFLKIENKQTITAIKLLDSLNKLDKEIKRLKPIKDVPNLSDTCKTYLCDVYTSVVFGRTEDIRSKYWDKGTLVEEDAITNYSLLTGNFYKKNKERRSNEFTEGELDFVEYERVNDTKSNWSIYQFNRVVAKKINPIYHWQLDTYMWLWNKPQGRLIYSLIDTPKALIDIEIKRLSWDFIGTEEDFKEAAAEVVKLHTYPDIPLKDKVKIFDVKRSDERIDRLKSRIADCRKFLNSFEELSKLEIEEQEEEEENSEALTA